jgi:hypothetical protein
MLAPPEEAALGLRRALVEILRQLNRDEMEEPEVPGLELDELKELLTRRAFPLITWTETAQAVQVLLGNGFARTLTEPRYAWSRGRMVHERFTITTEGKALLLQATHRAGRIGAEITPARHPPLARPPPGRPTHLFSPRPESP